MKMPSVIRQPWFIGLAAVALVLVVGIPIYRSSHSAKASASSSVAGQPLAQDDIQGLVDRVSKHIVVDPADKPSIAIVQNPDVLRTQNEFFYKNAQAGDRLIVWSDKIILYSVSRDLILSMLPINGFTQFPNGTLTLAAPVVQPASVSQAPLGTVEILNGAKGLGLAKLVAGKFKQAGLNVVFMGSAKKTYAHTMVIKVATRDVTSTLQRLQPAFTNALFAATMPVGELAAKADVVVILGDDYKN